MPVSVIVEALDPPELIDPGDGGVAESAKSGPLVQRFVDVTLARSVAVTGPKPLRDENEKLSLISTDAPVT